MTNDEVPSRWARNVVRLHALLFGAVAIGCYSSPETLFGDAAWLQLARLAVLLLAVVLLILSVMLVGVSCSGSPSLMIMALLAVLAVDVQAPFLLFSQPASLEYLDRDLGVPWFAVPLIFLFLLGPTVHAALSLRRTLSGTPRTGELSSL